MILKKKLALQESDIFSSKKTPTDNTEEVFHHHQWLFQPGVAHYRPRSGIKELSTAVGWKPRLRKTVIVPTSKKKTFQNLTS